MSGHPQITVTDTAITIHVTPELLEADEPRYASGWSKIHGHILWWARQLVEKRTEEAAEERRIRERRLAENKVLTKVILDLLTPDEVKALNAAGLASAVTRVAAGLNASDYGAPVRVSVRTETP